MTQGTPFDRFIVCLLTAVAAAHAALVLLLPNLEEKFQLGDRAWDRTAKIDSIMAARDWNGIVEAVFYHSSPGDYIFFLPAYATFGAPGVIVQNIVLLLAGIYFLYRIGHAFFSPAVAKIATIAYCLLPSTLFHPQAFASESLCNPLLIISVYFALRMLQAEKPASRDVAVFTILSAVLCFTRYMFALFPLVVAVLLLLRAAPWWRAAPKSLAVAAGALSLILAWQAALLANNGRYEVAPSFHGLSSNLYLRADRMARMDGFGLPEDVAARRSMSPGAFVDLALEHPRSFVRSALSDAVNMIANTGVSMAYGRYLGLFNLNESTDKDTFQWRDIRDTQGTWAMVSYLWKVSPVGLTINLAAVTLWALVLVLTLYGFVVYALRSAHPVPVRLLFAAVPAYVFTFSFIAGSIRWDHRSPMEFVICLFFAVGVMLLARRLQRRGDSEVIAGNRLLKA